MTRPRRMLMRLRERRVHHRRRSRFYRIVFAVAGFFVLTGGVLLLVLPGPGLLLIGIGLGMLALEFSWAERLLESAVGRLEQGLERVRRRRGAPPGVDRAPDAPEKSRGEAA